MRAILTAAGAVTIGILAGCATPGDHSPGRTWDPQTRTVVGTVFDDRNENGVHDQGERGVKGVRVSNGREIVVTDRRGRYELPIDDDTIIFVIKPRGWRTVIDGLRLPRFYYVHKPEGTPPLKYAAVAPTGPLPSAVDFALYRQREPERFDVVLFGDSQPYTIDEVDYFAHDVVEQVIGVDAAFGMSLGDLVGDDLDLHDPLNRTVAHIGIPFYNVLGNHDMDYEAVDDRHSDDHFEAVYGPSYYSFDYGPVHFVVLDSVVWHGKTAERDGHYQGGLGEEQLTFLRNDLALVPKDQLVVLTMHIPMIEFGDKDALYALLAQHPHTVSFSAHWHVHEQWFLDGDDGWPGERPHHHTTLVTTCGSWWKGAPDEVGIPHTTMRDGAPNGWVIATFDGNQYACRFQAARRPASYQMNIHLPEVVAAAEVADTEVLVNVFAGTERSTVEMRFDDGAWAMLERIERIDPYYAALKAAEQGEHPPRGNKLPNIRATQHLWRGTLPGGAAPGSHLITVRTTDMFGQGYEAHRIMRVQ